MAPNDNEKIQHQPHRAGTDLRRELVACLLAHGPTFSRVGASGKPGAVHRAILALESVREHQAGLQSFRSMRRIDARRKNASALRLRFSQSLASLRQRLSQAMVRSTTQRRGSTTNPFA